MKSGIKRYNLLMLSANRMLQETYVRCCAEMKKEPNLDKTEDKDKIEFAFDINDFSFQQGPLLSTDEHNDSPMYYQIRACLEKKKNGNDEKDVLRKHILYVDFSEIYGYDANMGRGNYPMIHDWSGKKELEEQAEVEEKLKEELEEKLKEELDEKLKEELDEELKIKLKEEFENKLNELKIIPKRARWLALFFEKGFDLTFEDKKTIHFVPFDKSGNMSRHSKMTFLDAALSDEMEKRVCLDIDFTKIKISLSKYYAYRGLLLTDGRRISTGENIILDEKHVIVLDDDNHGIDGVHIVTNKNDQYPIVSFEEKKNAKIEVNAFDGEGLIAPDYAEAINEQLVGKNEEKATSFQIRLPFGKGMLHQVDFQQFYEDQGIRVSETTIKDTFGIERALEPVRIILTKSMLKCTGWLKDFCKLDENETKWDQYKATDGKVDPMKYYFSKMKEYDHSLYIGNTNLNLSDSWQVKLNYQFLNTLDISKEDINKEESNKEEKNRKEGISEEDIRILLKKHYAKAKEAGEGTKKSIKHVITDLPSEEQEQENEERGMLETDTTWKYALRRNPDFLIDKKIRNSCSKQEDAMIKDGGVGRIVVSGTMRYLSGDLLGLLIHSIKSMKLEEPTKSDITRTLEQNILYEDKFYLPINEKESIKLKGSNYYGLLRSPHLSRNEQVAMRPFRSTYYDDYFKHLRGVLMVAYNSTAPMALGGADFDGDYVKLIVDPFICRAILSGTYYKNKEGNYKRKLPIPVIRGWGSNISNLEDDKSARAKKLYKLIDTTFDNRVGLISNLAISYGAKEYSYKQTGKEKPGQISECVKCTILTGLEIDAAKNGARPKLKESLKDTQEKESNKNFSYIFLTVKNKLEDVNTYAGVRSIHSDPKRLGKALIWNKEKKINEELVELHYEKEKEGEQEGNESTETNNKKQILEILIEEMINCIQEKREIIQTRENNNDAEEKNVSSKPVRFTYEKSIEDMNKIEADQDKLSKARKLVATYLLAENSIRRYSRLIREAQKFEQYRKAYSRLSMDYDFTVDKISHTGGEIGITTALNRTYNWLTDLLSSKKCDTGSVIPAKDAIAKMKSKKWYFTLEEDRERVFGEIMSTEQQLNKETIPDEVRELLFGNEEDRFFLLWYLLKTIEDEQTSNPDSATIPIDNEKNLIEKELYKEIWNMYMESLKSKEAKSILMQNVVKIVRKELGDLFDNKMDKCLEYCDYLRFHAPQSMRVDPDGDFFWSIFEMKEIKNCIYPEIKKENSDAK